MQSFYCLALIVFISSGESSVNVYRQVKCLPTNEIPGEPLILTPLIESGNITLAQNISRVKPLKDNIVSYAGFITVNKQYNSNMFFWFFPAVNNSATAPVLLWLEGGPGVSSLYGLFEEIGPFYLNKKGKLKSRKYSWSNTHSVLYIDNPVGTGYSFTDKDEGYSRNEDDVSKNLYVALVQFFQLFPQYQKNDFFVTGESYAGKFVPAISYAIHKNNPTANLKINLKGLIMGNAYCDPEHMVTSYGDYFYQLGLIDGRGRDMFHSEEQKGVAYIKQKNWNAAYDVFDKLLGPTFNNLTGFEFYFNYLYATENSPFGSLDEYIQKEEVRKAIHVGNATFNTYTKVEQFLKEDIMQSVKPLIETLLENYRIVFYSGQLDIIVAYPYTVSFLNSLNWSGTGDYKTATRNKWYVGKDLAGYAKTVKNFTEILVRNAGHLVPLDRPLWAIDIINRVTSNIPFA